MQHVNEVISGIGEFLKTSKQEESELENRLEHVRLKRQEKLEEILDAKYIEELDRQDVIALLSFIYWDVDVFSVADIANKCGPYIDVNMNAQTLSKIVNSKVVSMPCQVCNNEIIFEFKSKSRLKSAISKANSYANKKRLATPIECQYCKESRKILEDKEREEREKIWQEKRDKAHREYLKREAAAELVMDQAKPNALKLYAWLEVNNDSDLLSSKEKGFILEMAYKFSHSETSTFSYKQASWLNSLHRKISK